MSADCLLAFVCATKVTLQLTLSMHLHEGQENSLELGETAAAAGTLIETS